LAVLSSVDFDLEAASVMSSAVQRTEDLIANRLSTHLLYFFDACEKGVASLRIGILAHSRTTRKLTEISLGL
jgi:hypothetical protein